MLKIGPVPQLLAHVSIEGWSDLGNGAIHPFFNPAQLLVIIGLALLIGRQVPFRAKWPLIGAAISSAIGLALTLGTFSLPYPTPVITGIALCLGMLIALAWEVPEKLALLLAIIAGLALGLDSGRESGGLWPIGQSLLGTFASVNFLLLYLSFASSNATGRPWAVTGIRILGSWLVAIALMVLAFALKGKGA